MALMHWNVSGWPFPLSFTWLFEKNFVFVGYPRVKSTNVGIALDEGVFDRMEMVSTQVLCVRGIQAMSLKWHKTSVEMDKLQRSFVGPLTKDLGQIQSEDEPVGLALWRRPVTGSAGIWISLIYQLYTCQLRGMGTCWDQCKMTLAFEIQSVYFVWCECDNSTLDRRNVNSKRGGRNMYDT
jgi:hypothetical protein